MDGCMYMYVCMYACMYMYMEVMYVCICVCVYVCMFVCHSVCLSVQVIDGVEEEEEHKFIDLYVLFVLHTIPSRKRCVCHMFLSKVKGGLFTSQFISTMFNCQIPMSRNVLFILLLLLLVPPPPSLSLPSSSCSGTEACIPKCTSHLRLPPFLIIICCLKFC